MHPKLSRLPPEAGGSCAHPSGRRARCSRPMYAGPRRASRSPPQLQRAALHSPASEQELGQVHAVGNITSPLEVAGESLRLARDHDVAAVAERVEAEHSHVPISREDRVREPALEDRTAGVVEGASCLLYTSDAADDLL